MIEEKYLELFMIIIFSIYFVYLNIDNGVLKTANIIFLESTILGQYLVKDYIYKIINNVKKLIIIDSEFNLLKKNISKVRNKSIINKLESMFIFYENEFIHNINGNKTGNMKNPKNNFIETLKLIYKLDQYSLKNTFKLKKSINEIISELNKIICFLECPKLENCLINPLILSFYGEKSYCSPIYIYGSPGVGKTLTVKKISEIIEGKIYSYTVNKKHYDVYSDMYNSSNIDIILDHMNPISKIISKQEGNPSILLFDEFDKMVLRNNNDDKNLLELLTKVLSDSEKKIYDDKYLHLSDIIIPENIIFVFIGNKPLSEIFNGNNQHFKSRFIEINIPDLKKEKQLEILCKKAENYNTYTPEDHDPFFKEMIECNDFKGVRELINYQNLFFNALKYNEIIKKFKKEKSVEEIKEEILNDLKELDLTKEKTENIEPLKKESDNKNNIFNIGDIPFLMDSS